jgi:hypothetical protein
MPVHERGLREYEDAPHLEAGGDRLLLVGEIPQTLRSPPVAGIHRAGSAHTREIVQAHGSELHKRAPVHRNLAVREGMQARPKVQLLILEDPIQEGAFRVLDAFPIGRRVQEESTVPVGDTGQHAESGGGFAVRLDEERLAPLLFLYDFPDVKLCVDDERKDRSRDRDDDP